MSRIEVKICPKMPDKWRTSNYLKGLVKYQQSVFDCPKCFDGSRRFQTAVHEAGHWIYAWALGLNPYTEGPCVCWDEKKDGLVTREAVVYHDQIPASIRPTDAVKVGIASFVFRKELTGTLDKRETIAYDLQDARSWYVKHYPSATEDDFQQVIKEATQEVIADLQRPEFRQEALNKAHEIDRELFGEVVSHDGKTCKGHLFLGVNYSPASQA